MMTRVMKHFGLDVEYFHFNITGDDRMRYLGQNVVLEEHLSRESRLCNAVIAHLYGRTLYP
jgi:hypothetical protein